MSSANCFNLFCLNLDLSKILLSGNGLRAGFSNLYRETDIKTLHSLITTHALRPDLKPELL